jgi:hypothetical protein
MIPDPDGIVGKYFRKDEAPIVKLYRILIRPVYRSTLGPR